MAPTDPAAAKKRRTLAWGFGGLAALLALGVGAWLLFFEPDDGEGTRGFGAYTFGPQSQIYYGEPRLVRRPAVVLADRVFERIPEYREIVERGLPGGTQEYEFLILRASKKFKRAVRGMAAAHRHDLVAEVGAVVPNDEEAAEPVERTDETIAQLAQSVD